MFDETEQFFFSLDESEKSINIAEVLNVISRVDPSFETIRVEEVNLNEGTSKTANMARPYIKIIEQPGSNSVVHRFRYISESRLAGSIHGANSTAEDKTYPTIEICNLQCKQADLYISCVTKDDPYKPHPHRLVGKELCNDGVCHVTVYRDNPVLEFRNLGIQCTKKKDIEKALQEREKIHRDPFQTGFSHKKHPQNISLNAVRLCFELVYQDELTKKILSATPVVSEIIYDKKAITNLEIINISHKSSSVMGGETMILLCEKVVREDVVVTFSKFQEDKVVWQAEANIKMVHKQMAIVLEVPRYMDIYTTKHIPVVIQLRRPSDEAISKPWKFEYIPINTSPALSFIGDGFVKVNESLSNDVEIEMSDEIVSSTSNGDICITIEDSDPVINSKSTMNEDNFDKNDTTEFALFDDENVHNYILHPGTEIVYSKLNDGILIEDNPDMEIDVNNSIPIYELEVTYLIE